MTGSHAYGDSHMACFGRQAKGIPIMGRLVHSTGVLAMQSEKNARMTSKAGFSQA